MVIESLPFDKYGMEPSPLTQFILARKQPTVCWQVTYKNNVLAVKVFFVFCTYMLTLVLLNQWSEYSGYHCITYILPQVEELLFTTYGFLHLSSAPLYII
jgi:hypothetical protein